MWGVCLALASMPAASVRFIETDQFTLAWTHSIEKVRWEEDYRIVTPEDRSEQKSSRPRLTADHARIRGSAAGMEPPSDARLLDGWYVYQPEQPLEPVLRLTRSGYTADYEWCVNGNCVSMESILPSDGGVTLLYACKNPAALSQ